VYIPAVTVHQPESLEEASLLLRTLGPRARFLAGGTDLLVDLKTGRLSLDHVVSLSRLDALRGISVDHGVLRIGAMSTPNRLAGHPAVGQRWSPLLDALLEMAAVQVRNMATVGGNIASAIPSADLPPILMAMHATVVLRSWDGERVIPLTEFFVGPRESVRRDGEVLTAILVPEPPRGFGAAYARFALREANACAVAGVAASLQLDARGAIEDARLVLGAVAPTPRTVDRAAQVLIGRLPAEGIFLAAAKEAMAAADPISDIRASADFRRKIVGVLTQRALRKAHARTEEAAA